MPARPLGLIAYALVTINLMVQAGVMFTDLFIAGAFPKNAPGVLDGTVEDGRLSAGCLLAWVLPLSFLLLGIASLLAGVYRKVVGWAFIVMGAATLVALPFNEPVVEVTIGVARVVVSAFARRVPELAIESPTPHPYSPRRSGHEHATDAGSSTTTATSPVPGFRYRRRQGP